MTSRTTSVGVEAPAVTATLFMPVNQSISISDTSETRYEGVLAISTAAAAVRAAKSRLSRSGSAQLDEILAVARTDRSFMVRQATGDLPTFGSS